MSKNGKPQRRDPGPLPPVATYCRHCNLPFPVSISVIGEPADSEYLRTCGILALHLQQKHPEQVRIDVSAQVACSIAYSAQRVLANFNSNDEGLMLWRDRERHRIFRTVLRGSVSDEKIVDQVTSLFNFVASPDKGPRTPTLEEIVLLVKSMRDAIEERNLYPEVSLDPSQTLISRV